MAGIHTTDINNIVIQDMHLWKGLGGGKVKAKDGIESLLSMSAPLEWNLTSKRIGKIYGSSAAQLARSPHHSFTFFH